MISRRLVVRDWRWNMAVAPYYAAISALACALPLVVVLLVVGFDEADEEKFANACIAVALTGGVVVASRCLRMGVWLASDNRLTIRGPFRTQTIPTEEIVNERPRRLFYEKYCIEVVSFSGSVTKLVPVPADRGHVLAQLIGRPDDRAT